MGLLMSLVLAEQIDNDTIRGIDIMVIGHDLLTIQRLLMYGASFARRLVMHSSVCDLVASVTRDPSGTGTFLINAGCMLLASNGLCLMTNLNALRKEQKEKLRRVMENRGETIEIPKKFTECTQHLRVPIKTTAWACSEPLQTAPKWGVTELWDQSLTLEPKQVLDFSCVTNFDLVICFCT
ncbi:minichromosome maintenance domain-containing protein 2-like [Actinia tenebrosa]|uniref:Minichromosome maintenance domain-containing protein 2-like n=1 Tax=Actinia tenebrosa TaxID=6105 RepID=A0A6P8ISM4_ACTTE|nr:minichromosome maintenance domain-containing protein 2-like [Actinia tenebrosa]